MFDKYVYPFKKQEYFKGKKPEVDCILCEIIKNNPDVINLKICETSLIYCSVNLYPYNSGHTMIFPKRHITDIRNLTKEEECEIWELGKIIMDLLEKLYKPTGFNMGFNIGKFSGASIDHIHLHIIPRYPNELGIIDLIGGAKVLIENPKVTQRKLQNELKNYLKNNKIDFEIRF